MPGWDPVTLGLVALGLVAGGLTKGFAGSGLPMVSVATMAIVIDAPSAVALMPIPILLTNLRQALRGGHATRALRRFWRLLLFLPLGTVVGVRVLTGVDQATVAGIVGGIVVVFALVGQVRFAWRVSAPRERRLQPLVGLSAGLIGGVSTVFAPPIIMLMLSLRLPKDEYVGAVGLAYLVGIVCMILALAGFGRMGASEALWSAAATVPVFAGMLVGERLRGRVPESAFRRAVLVLLLLSGLNMVRQSLM